MASVRERAYLLRNPGSLPSTKILLGVLVKAQSARIPLLVGTKLIHTAIWFFFAGCVVAIPLAGARRQYVWVAVLTGLVLMECAILAVNQGRCPLTDLAGRY